MTNLHAKAVAIREPHLQSYEYVRSDGQVSFTSLPAPTEPVAAQVVTLVGAYGATDRVAANPAIGSGDAEAAQGICFYPLEFNIMFIENPYGLILTGTWEWRGTGAPGSNYGSWFNTETTATLHPDLNHGPPDGPHYDYIPFNKAGFKYKLLPNGTSRLIR